MSIEEKIATLEEMIAQQRDTIERQANAIDELIEDIGLPENYSERYHDWIIQRLAEEIA